MNNGTQIHKIPATGSFTNNTFSLHPSIELYSLAPQINKKMDHKHNPPQSGGGGGERNDNRGYHVHNKGESSTRRPPRYEYAQRSNNTSGVNKKNVKNSREENSKKIYTIPKERLQKFGCN